MVRPRSTKADSQKVIFISPLLLLSPGENAASLPVQVSHSPAPSLAEFLLDPGAPLSLKLSDRIFHLHKCLGALELRPLIKLLGRRWRGGWRERPRQRGLHREEDGIDLLTGWELQILNDIH